MIIKSGKYTKSDLKISYNKKRIRRSEKQFSYIENIWNVEKQKDYELFNGSLLSITDLKTNNEIEITVCDSSYKEFVGTRNKKFSDEFGISSVVNPLSVGSILKTSDNKLVFGKRSEKIDLSKGRISIPSGWVDPSSDINEGQIDVFSAVKREIYEEVGIPSTGVKNLICLGIIKNPSFTHTFLPFFANTVDSELLIQYSRNSEFEKIILIDDNKESIRDFKKENLSDIARPRIKLYEKINW